MIHCSLGISAFLHCATQFDIKCVLLLLRFHIGSAALCCMAQSSLSCAGGWELCDALVCVGTGRAAGALWVRAQGNAAVGVKGAWHSWCWMLEPRPVPRSFPGGAVIAGASVGFCLGSFGPVSTEIPARETGAHSVSPGGSCLSILHLVWPGP